MEKKTKKVSLDLENGIVVDYGTMDYINFKSAFMQFRCWVQPNNSEYIKHLDTFKRSIKDELKSILNNQDKFDKSFYIVDLKLKDNRMNVNKKSFMQLTVNLYNKGGIRSDWNKEVKHELVNISKTLSNTITNNNNITLTKTGK